MVKKPSVEKLLEQIHTVHGVCPECQEDAIMVAIVTDYYRCTNCGQDTRQYVNGSIKYLRLDEDDIKWLRKNKLAQPKS